MAYACDSSEGKVLKSGCQLNGIIATQSVCFSQGHGARQNVADYVQNPILIGKVAAEIADNGNSIGR